MSEGVLTLGLWLGILFCCLKALYPVLKAERCHIHFMKDIEDWLLNPEKPLGITPFHEAQEGYTWIHESCPARGFRHP